MPTQNYSHSNTPAALTIAGSDSGGAAGIQADLLSFAAAGVYGTSALTCITAQNPESICNIGEVTSKLVADQIQQVLEYYPIKAIKSGMLYNKAIIKAVAAILKQWSDIPYVLDPVMIATSGHALLKQDAIDAYQSELFPMAQCITPNLDEAESLLSTKISSVDAMLDAAKTIFNTWGTPTLIKGGHLSGDNIVDVLYDGNTHQKWSHKRIPNVNTHGSGCTLSALITANLAKGKPLPDAIDRARRQLILGMKDSITLNTHPFINHFPKR